MPVNESGSVLTFMQITCYVILSGKHTYYCSKRDKKILIYCYRVDTERKTYI